MNLPLPSRSNIIKAPYYYMTKPNDTLEYVQNKTNLSNNLDYIMSDIESVSAECHRLVCSQYHKDESMVTNPEFATNLDHAAKWTKKLDHNNALMYRAQHVLSNVGDFFKFT